MLLLFAAPAAMAASGGQERELDRCLNEIARGDLQALEALYRQTSPAVYSFALSILKNPHDAEDVLQDCYLSIHSAAGSYRSEGKPLAWVLTITRNLCIQKLRENKRRADLAPEDWERYLEQNTDARPEDRLMIAECMKTLSDEERQIVVLHAVSGFKHREIGDLLGLKLSTVLSKYRRALKKLKKEWGEEEKP